MPHKKCIFALSKSGIRRRILRNSREKECSRASTLAVPKQSDETNRNIRNSINSNEWNLQKNSRHYPGRSN